MLSNIKILPQSSFDMNGYFGLQDFISIPFYNYESNPSNYFNTKDWGISLQYGAEFSGSFNSSIYLLAISKRLGDHSLSARYTPGFQKEFLFSTGESIVVNDTTTQSLEANYTYKELFGLGYSYKINEKLSAGLTLRFFEQDFKQQIVKPVFGDTLYLVTETLSEKLNFWKADIGIDYILNDHLQFRLASINLLNFGDDAITEEFQGFEMKQERGAFLAASYFPDDFLNLNFIYETTNSFQISATGNANKFVYGLTTFHDQYQEPYIAGLVPAFGYKTSLFEILLSGVYYFSDRTTEADFSQFYEEGIDNIINNRYSFDKIVLSLGVNISSTEEKKVELIDVEIIREIYPTFYDMYLDKPFATGRVVNISSEQVKVTPSVNIEGITEGKIDSPQILVEPGDTINVPFYLIISENLKLDRATLSNANFYVNVTANQPDDQLQKATLINSENAWDGNVVNLRYFISKEMNFSMNYAKNTFSENKNILDSLPVELYEFEKAKILFNNFVKKMTYVSDPRASVEYVQFPNQTFELKGGDCDDLSVAYCSLLESVGIQTALVDYKGNEELRHVNIMFNTKLSPEKARLITNNDSKYFIRKNEQGKDEIWIPIETTSLSNYNEAWNIAAEKFNREALNNLGLASGKVEIIEVY